MNRLLNWLRSPYGLVTIAAVCWSSIGLLCKIIKHNDNAMTAIRGLAYSSYLTLVIWSMWHHKHARLGSDLQLSWHRTTILTAKRIFATWDWSHWLAALFLAGNVLAITKAFQTGTAATATFLNSGSLLIIAALSGCLLGEPTTKRGWVAIAIGLCGMTILALDGLWTQGASTSGTIYGLIAAGTSSLGLLCLKRRENKDNGETAGLESFALAGFLVAVGLAVFNPDVIRCGLPSMSDSVLIGVLAIFASGIPDVLYIRGMKGPPVMTLTDAMVRTRISPILTPVWPWLLLGEVPTLFTVIGAIIVTLAVVLSAVWKPPAVGKCLKVEPPVEGGL